MQFVPVAYDDADRFRAACWTEGAPGLTVFDEVEAFEVGEEVIIEVSIRGTGVVSVVRGTVIWRRPHEDRRSGLPAAAGVRIDERDLARFDGLAGRVDAVAPPLMH